MTNEWVTAEPTQSGSTVAAAGLNGKAVSQGRLAAVSGPDNPDCGSKNATQVTQLLYNCTRFAILLQYCVAYTLCRSPTPTDNVRSETK
jgi:hypothetical protein